MQATQPIPTFQAPKTGLIATVALAVALVGGALAVQVGGLGLGAGTTERAVDPAAGFVQQRAGERELGGSGSGLSEHRSGEIGFGGAAGSAADGSSGVGPQAGRQGRMAR